VVVLGVQGFGWLVWFGLVWFGERTEWWEGGGDGFESGVWALCYGWVGG